MSLFTLKRKAPPLTVREVVLFALYGTLMYATKVIMAALPNIHLVGMFIILFTILHRAKALIPIYIYVFLEGLFGGFTLWWIPYLYIWTILFGVTMLLPKNLPDKYAAFIYPIICGLHGFAFGILFAPAQSILFGLDFKGMIAWIIAGIPFDITHGVANTIAGALVLPLSKVLKKLLTTMQI